ncbi:MAG: tetratricopeptide repeat protein [Patescibacteria group bacterium]
MTNKHEGQRKKAVIVPLLIISLLLVALFRVPLGVASWKVFRAPSIALFLNPDAALALEIGNRYFNVGLPAMPVHAGQAGGSDAYDLDKAEKYFNKALTLDPLAPDAWHQLSRIDFLRGNFSAALSKINTQFELHGDSLMASYYIRGLIEGYSGDYENAEKDFLKFFAWDKTNWAVYNDLSWVYFKEGRYKDARRVADGGLAYHPNNPWLLNMAGVSRLNLDDKKNARIYFQKALWWADTMTESDWQKAYPGNAPYTSGQGIIEMKEAIRANLDLAVDK